MAPHAEIAARFVDDDFGYNGFWYSTAGYAIRWSLFGLFVLIILLWVVGGYFHAKHLMKKGLPLKSYHSCFFPRQPRMQQAGWYRPYNAYPYGPQQDGYNMNYMPPPPTYDANRPPEYQQGPPAGASKVDPSQWSGQPTNRPAESSTTGAGVAPEYASPPGPPPAVTRQ
ncbi:chitin synthesis regulation, resistance to congo red domain-containing protein [Cordyceps javanica]|uniref:Chitin synthesis regulation, resistance to congo red domain-containing protein n=1 Tax=Cordyceps javanica TaxID=43265 RepID=A0A545VAE8_9HYPO|nr:chitin synthesis regulation, resistance to congo red domain-containing protein [Cordyceps javanica]TQW09792.1 chitin synthesis regulation, resistance to congo red domain-containing protein [Cordyceps javanica]